MPTEVTLAAGGHEFTAVFNDSATARALLERLPLTVQMSRWGEEYYGNVGAPLGVDAASDARDEMKVGELAFWIPGNAFCVFFGPTPASRGSEPRAASAVNPVGEITANVDRLTELGASVEFEITTK